MQCLHIHVCLLTNTYSVYTVASCYRYNVLKEFYTNQAGKEPLPDDEAVGVVLRKVGVVRWESGRSKVLLKYNHPVELERHSRNIHLHIIAIQRCKINT